MAMLTEKEVHAGSLSMLYCPMLDDFKAALKHRKNERPANGFVKKLFLAIYKHFHRKVMSGERQKWFIPIKDSLPAPDGIMVCKKDVAKAMIEQQHPLVRQVTESIICCSFWHV